MDRFRRRAPLTPEETASAMLDLAEGFRRGSAAEGVPLGWESGEAARLDGICDAFMRTRPPAEFRHTFVMGLGAYLGELLVRHGGGTWIYDAQARAAVVDMPNGLQAHPHNKVAKRLAIGAEHNLFTFYWYGLTREVPPGTTIAETE